MNSVRELREFTEMLAQILAEQDCRIFKMFYHLDGFGEKKTAAEIADRFGIKPERVMRIIKERCWPRISALTARSEVWLLREPERPKGESKQ